MTNRNPLLLDEGHEPYDSDADVDAAQHESDI